MSKDRTVVRLNEILLDATGFNSINDQADFREFIFRLILLFPDIDFAENHKRFFMFLFTDSTGELYKFNLLDLLKLKNGNSFRNEINNETFIEKIDSYRAIAITAQIFSGVSMLNIKGRMIILAKGKINFDVLEITEAYNLAAEIIETGRILIGDGFSFDS